MFIPNFWDDEVAGLNKEEDLDMDVEDMIVNKQREILDALEPETLKDMIFDLWAALNGAEKERDEWTAAYGNELKAKFELEKDLVDMTTKFQNATDMYQEAAEQVEYYNMLLNATEDGYDSGRLKNG